MKAKQTNNLWSKVEGMKSIPIYDLGSWDEPSFGWGSADANIQLGTTRTTTKFVWKAICKYVIDDNYLVNITHT